MLRDVGALATAAAAIGVSFGAIAIAAGLPGWLAVAMSVLVFAGGSQFMAVGLLAAGSPLGALVGGLLLNARHLPFGLAIAGGDQSTARGEQGAARNEQGTVRGEQDAAGDGEAGTSGDGEAGRTREAGAGAGTGTGGAGADSAGGGAVGRRWWARLVGSHLLIDESVAFAMAQSDPRRRRSAYWLTGVALFGAWNLGTWLGVLLGGAVADPVALGLDAAFPAGLLALLWPSLRDPVPRRVALAGSAVALLTTPVLPAGMPVLLALTGLLTVGVGRWRRGPGRVREQEAVA